MKRILLLLNALLVCLLTWSHDFEEKNDEGVTIYYESLTSSTVAVTYKGNSYSSYTDRYTDSVVIPSTVTHYGTTYSVTSIADRAFYNCKGLTWVNIPNSVTSIGNCAFDNCKGMSMINIPNSVTSIGNWAFCDCSELISVIIPNSVTSIGSAAFSGTALYNDDSKWENNVLYINNHLIKAKKDLTGAYTIKEGTLTIADGAFYSGSELGSIILSPSVTSIGENAFSDCISLSSVTIPNSVISIGKNAFSDCTGLISVNISDLTAWCTINFSDKYSNPLIYAEHLYLNNEDINDLIFPATVTSISNYAFNGYRGLTSVIIPPTVTSIGNSVFSGCSKFRYLKFEDSEYSIKVGSDSFNACPIETVYLGRNLQYNYKMFYNNPLYTIIIGTKVTSIPSYIFNDPQKIILLPNTPPEGLNNAFYSSGTNRQSYVANANYNGSNLGKINVLDYLSSYFDVDGVRYVPISPSERTCVAIDCTYDSSIEEINIGETVTYQGVQMQVIGVFDNTLYNNNHIKTLNVSSPCDIGNYLAYNCDSLQTVKLSNLGNIGSYAFYDCDNLQTVTASNHGEIGSYAFSDCDNLQTVTASNQGVIGTYAFYNCDNLQTVTASNQGDIGSHAFSDCDNLQTVTASNQGDIGSYAFYNCSNLQTVTSSNQGDIDSYAFSNCINLQNVSLTDDVTDIKDHAFSNCKMLSSINIPDTHTIINEGTFSGCSSLQEIILPTNLKKISKSAFASSGLVSLTIPGSTETVEDYAFDNCINLSSLTFNNGVKPLSLGCNGSNGTFNNSPLSTLLIGRDLNYNSASNGGYSPFYNIKSLASVVITDLPTSVPKNLFYKCSGLTNVTIGDGVTSIGDYAFSGCSALDNFTFGANLKKIGDEAFSDCISMTQLYAEAPNPPTCGNQALDDINKWKCKLYVDESAIPAYQTADQWKEFFNITEYEFPFILGDANGDGVITIADVTTIVNYILENVGNTFSLSGADINGDGVINIADITLCVALILEQQSNSVADVSMDSPMANVSYDAPYALEIGENTQFEITLQNCADYCALQFDVELPDGLNLESAKLNNSAQHAITAARISDITWRVVINSVNNSCLEEASLIEFAISGYATSADGVISIHNGLIDRTSFGNVTEEAMEDAKVYICNNLSGIHAINPGTSNLKVWGEGRTIYIKSASDCMTNITSVDGLNREVKVKAGINRFEMLTAGLYIVGNKKVVLK